MKSVAHILQTKEHREVYAVPSSASVLEAMRLMAEKGIGALLVMDGDDVAGIVSERDFARKMALKGRIADETPVSEVMSSPVMYVRPEQSNEECMVLMTENRLRHLPVIDKGKLIGLVSIGDLVKDIISEQQFIIGQLENYIRGEHAA